MIPIEVWWFIVDLDTKRTLYLAPSAPLTSEVAARIHDAGGVLSEGHFFSGQGTPGYELLPEDITWIQLLSWTPPPREPDAAA